MENTHWVPVYRFHVKYSVKISNHFFVKYSFHQYAYHCYEKNTPSLIIIYLKKLNW